MWRTGLSWYGNDGRYLETDYVRGAGYHKGRGLHTARLRPRLLYDDRSGLKPVEPRLTVPLAAELIKSGHEVIRVTHLSGVLEHQRTQTLNLAKEKSLVSLRGVSIEHVYREGPRSPPIKFLAPKQDPECFSCPFDVP